MDSPRIKDEVWNNFDSLSTTEGGSNSLRRNQQLQDLIIKSLQLTVQDLSNTGKKNHLRNALKVLSNILKNGKADPQVDICKSSSLPSLTLNLLRTFCRYD